MAYINLIYCSICTVPLLQAGGRPGVREKGRETDREREGEGERVSRVDGEESEEIWHKRKQFFSKGNKPQNGGEKQNNKRV